MIWDARWPGLQGPQVCVSGLCLLEALPGPWTFYSVAQILELLKWGLHSLSHDVHWAREQCDLSFSMWTSVSQGGQMGVLWC